MFWFRTVTIIYDHEKKVTKDPCHIQFICSINDYQYEEIMPFDIINNNTVNQEDKDIVWKLKHITAN